MLAYHGKPELKKRLLAEIAKHRRADAIVQGSYGHQNGQWKGCAIACSLRSLDKVKRKRSVESYEGEHHRYPTELGVPVELAHLEDRLFEGLPPELARKWPERFASAIRPGADLSMVWPRFAHWMLVDAEAGVIRFAKTDETAAAIRGVAALYERWIGGEKPGREELIKAQSAYAADSADARLKHYSVMTDKLADLLRAAPSGKVQASRPMKPPTGKR